MQSEGPVARFKGKVSPTSTEVTIVLLLVVVSLPYMFTYRAPGGHEISEIKALIWEIITYNDGSWSIRYFAFYNMINLPFVGFKYLLLVLFYRYYEGKTTRKRVLTVGVLGELQGFLFFGSGHVIAAILGTISWTEVYWMIPTPFALLTCIILLILAPRTKPKTAWIEHEEEKSWWIQEKS